MKQSDFQPMERTKTVGFSDTQFRLVVETPHMPRNAEGERVDLDVPFRILSTATLRWRSYQTRDEAWANIVEYIGMFYNSRRLHSYLGYQSPDEFERNGQLANAT